MVNQIDGQVRVNDTEVIRLKSGVLTTEFWLVCVAMICATVLAALGKVNTDQLLEFGQWVVGFYVGGRSLAKSGVLGRLVAR